MNTDLSNVPIIGDKNNESRFKNEVLPQPWR